MRSAPYGVCEQGVARFLARYLYGGPIGNHRLLGCRGGQVHFSYRLPSQKAGDRTRQGVMCLSVSEFLRRFLEHVPPHTLQTIRGYELYAGNQHSHLVQAFEALGTAPPELSSARLSVQALLEQLGIDTRANCCPVFGKELIVVDPYRRPYWRSARSPPPGSLALSDLAGCPA
jgi:hypothetical protein